MIHFKDGNYINFKDCSYFIGSKESYIPISHKLLLQMGFEQYFDSYYYKKWELTQQKDKWVLSLYNGDSKIFFAPVHYVHEIEIYSFLLNQPIELKVYEDTINP